MSKVKPWMLVLVLPLVCLLGYWSGYTASKAHDEQKLPSGILSREPLLAEIESVRRSNASLQDLLDQRDETILDLLATTKQVPETVVITKTVVEAADPVYVSIEPEPYDFRLDNGLLVARFEPGEQYKYQTADVELTAHLVVGETTALSMQATSSLEPNETLEITIDDLQAQTIAAQKEPVWKGPVFTVGASYGIAGAAANVGVEPVRRKNLSFGHVRADIGRDTIGGSIDPVRYRAGDHLRLFENLRVGIGMGYSLDRGDPKISAGRPTISASIGTSL